MIRGRAGGEERKRRQMPAAGARSAPGLPAPRLIILRLPLAIHGISGAAPDHAKVILRSSVEEVRLLAPRRQIVNSIGKALWGGSPPHARCIRELGSRLLDWLASGDLAAPASDRIVTPTKSKPKASKRRGHPR